MDEQSSVGGFLGFSDHDLEANREGVLSARQAWRLRWSGIWRLVVGQVVLAACLLVAFVTTTSILAAQPTADPAFGRTPLYAMPSIRPAMSGWPAAAILAGVAIVTFSTISLVARR